MTDGQLMMPAAPSEAWQQAQVLAMRQLGDLMSAQTKRIEGLGEAVQDVRDRVIRMEAQEINKSVESLRAELRAAQTRIDQLESQRDRVQGVAAFTSWISRVGPWLFAIAAGLWAGKETLSR